MTGRIPDFADVPWNGGPRAPGGWADWRARAEALAGRPLDELERDTPEGIRLRPLYTAADLLVQWSLYEGFGLPPLEAMACGTPALVSDGGSLAEIAGPAAEVVPLDEPIGRAQQLALCLRDLLCDPDRLATLRALGLAHAAHYTWPAHARAVAALYEELVNE